MDNVIIHENTKITTLRGDTNGQTKNHYSTGIPVGNGNYLRDFTELYRSKNFTESDISVFNWVGHYRIYWVGNPVSTKHKSHKLISHNLEFTKYNIKIYSSNIN